MTFCNPVEEYVVDYWFEHESEDGDKTIHAFSIDGRILMITKPNPTKLAELKKAASDESRQVDYSDWLRRRGDRTLLRKIQIRGTGAGLRNVRGNC